MKKILFCLLLVGVLQSCSKSVTSNNLVNTKWVLAVWPGKTLPTTAKATLIFDSEGRIGGKSFCNGYGGNTSFENGGIKFSQIFGTKMYCEEVGDAENKFTADLAAVNSAKIVAGNLQLLQDGEVKMVFVKTD